MPYFFRCEIEEYVVSKLHLIYQQIQEIFNQKKNLLTHSISVNSYFDCIFYLGYEYWYVHKHMQTSHFRFEMTINL